MKEMTEERALSRLAALCSRGEHSAGEMDEKMRRWGLDEDARERAKPLSSNNKATSRPSSTSS